MGGLDLQSHKLPRNNEERAIRNVGCHVTLRGIWLCDLNLEVLGHFPMAAVSLHKRPFDILVVVFLLIHIPVTIFVDSQAGELTPQGAHACLAILAHACPCHGAKRAREGNQLVGSFMHSFPVQCCQESGIQSLL